MGTYLEFGPLSSMDDSEQPCWLLRIPIILKDLKNCYELLQTKGHRHVPHLRVASMLRDYDGGLRHSDR